MTINKMGKFTTEDLLNDSLAVYDEKNSELQNLPINEETVKQIMNPIFREILKESRILIVGDYDVDGFFSAIELKPYLELLATRTKHKANIETYYSERKTGYSMPEFVFKNFQNKYDFIIFLDTGSSYSYFDENTKNVIIIDHHKSQKNKNALPYIYNPNRDGKLSTSTGKITYDIIDKYEHILVRKFGLEKTKLLHDVLKVNQVLAGITLCSDMAKMTSENKSFLDKSLSSMTANKKQFPWLAGIIHKEITSLDLSFNVINKINSYSRMGKNLKEIENIFLPRVSLAKIRRNSSSTAIKTMIKNMNEVHTNRKSLTALLEKDLSIFLKNVYYADKDVLSIVLDNKYTGINGLLAQNTLNRTSKPNIVISYDSNKDSYVGSGRGTGIFTALKEVAKNIENIKFGGHNEAIGVEIPNESLNDFNLAISNFRFKEKQISEKKEKFYFSTVSDFKSAIEHYSFLSPKTILDNKYYAIIKKYKNMGIVEKANGWYCSSICDNIKKITIYFKEHNLNEIKNNLPIALEITNQSSDQNFFIENKEICKQLIQNLENENQGVSRDVTIN